MDELLWYLKLILAYIKVWNLILRLVYNSLALCVCRPVVLMTIIKCTCFNVQKLRINYESLLCNVSENFFVTVNITRFSEPRGSKCSGVVYLHQNNVWWLSAYIEQAEIEAILSSRC